MLWILLNLFENAHYLGYTDSDLHRALFLPLRLFLAKPSLNVKAFFPTAQNLHKRSYTTSATQAQEAEPDKKTVLSYVGKAKSLMDGV